MSIVANLPRAIGSDTRKLAVAQGAVTGTGGIATGLSSIDTGAAVASVANAPTTVTTQTCEISSISGGTVNIVVVDLQAAANAISGTARNINVIAVGH